MTDLRIVRIIEECDESIQQISEALKDMKAGIALPAETEKLLRRLRDRVPVLEQQMDKINKEYDS